ncbi:MAG: hypothetical protein M3Q07_14035, partial [Pseudobdellovibrionaceae bacterium]|nr:hypothetical protein [Pseudobdellovibrionaceae bacterium]
MSRLLLVLLCCVAFSCVNDKPLEDVLASPQSPGPVPAPVAEQKRAAAPEKVREAPIPAPSADCQTLPSGIKLPYYISGSSVIVIGFLKTCQTMDGQE